MIDLSYLTEEEQEVILAVLKRDTLLNETEEQRITKLKKTQRCSVELRCQTGEWFTETKSRRHGDHPHASDIIRASMRDHRPVTILELSQICPGKPSFLNREMKDVFIPPELCGLIEVVSHPHHMSREEETQGDDVKAAVSTQAKPRQNPFNPPFKILELESPRKADVQLPTRARAARHTPADTRHTPAETDHTPVDIRHTPADAHHTPVDIRHTPADTDHAPADTHHTPVNTHQAPADTHHTPVNTHQAPADTHLTPADTDQAPADTDHTAVDIRHTPADTHHAPVSTHQAPADTHLTPADTDQAPADTHQVPTDIHQAPVDTHGAPAGMHLPSIEPLKREGHEDSLQRPAMGHHMDCAGPHSSQVSEHQASVVEQGCHEDPGVVRAAQQHTGTRPMSVSKSLEDMATLDLLSVAPQFPGSSVSDREQKKMSTSVPALTQQQSMGRQSDLASVDIYYSERARKDSTDSHLSSSTGPTSMSSVSGSVMNISGCDHGNVEVRGTIQFALNYVEKPGELHIFIVRCRDLAVAELKRNRSDPYVKCYLLPDKDMLGKRKTSVKKKTLNPTYNEILRYNIPMDSLKKRTLNISVWHNDTFGRNNFLGEVNKDLSEWDINNTHIMDCALKGRIPLLSSPKHVNVEMNGEIKVALCFILLTSNKKVPQTGEIQIVVKECKNLLSRGGNTFVKCTILPDTGRKSLQKTHVVKKTANPVFNYTMVYDDFKPEDVREACVELTVWDRDRLSNHFIGGTRLSLGTGASYGAEVNWMDSSTAEAALWKRMIESQNEWVEDMLPLRMLMMARTMARK